MPSIIAGVVSLIQHIKLSSEAPQLYHLERCPSCGGLGLWRHGCYQRKADRHQAQGESLNPINIQRFYCPGCKKTCSALPECIPPRRWYLWDVQQLALILWLGGKSLYRISKEMAPSRHTLARWMKRLKGRDRLHKDALCTHFVALGRASDFTGFWSACLKQISLGAAMRICHVSGVIVP